MDSVKFLEFKNTEDKCRSIASNTVPVACANCGSNDYNIPTLQQANYLAPLYPAMPSFKMTSDSFKDNTPVNSHFFPRPFFQPVFHNSSILSNPFYACNNIGMMLQNPYRQLSQEQKQEKCESNNKATQASNCSDYLLSQIHQMPTCMDETNFGKLQPKDNNAGGDNITNDLEGDCRSKNSEESGTDFPSQCVCNNTTPWLYSPFILPIISYYILWNSQCSNSKLPSGNDSCNNSQIRQNKREDDEAKVSDTLPNKGKNETDFNKSKEKLPKKSKDGASEDFWTDDKIPKIINHKDGSSSSLFSISSLDYGEDTFFYKRKNEAKAMLNGCGTEIGTGKSNAGTSPNEHKEAGESTVKCDTNESDTQDAELDEKVKAYASAPLSADIEEEDEKEEEEEEEEDEEEENEDENENNENDEDVDEDEDDVKYVNTSNEESSITEQASDLKTQNEFETEMEMMPSEIQYNVVGTPSEVIIASVLSSSEEKLEGDDTEDKKPMSSESVRKDRITHKKLITNFTMADETSSKFYEESKTLASMAAGGDLGGEHCVGYRIEISPPPGRRGNVQNLDKNESEMKTNKTSKKDLEKQNNDNSTNKKKSPEGGEFENKSKAKEKLGRNLKSGIAKLSCNFKAKCTDSNRRYSEVKKCEPEMPKTRRKHNCMATVKTTENNERNSKIQKSKYSRERQGKNLDSARENVPPKNMQKQGTKSTDSRQKRKDQQVRAPWKSSI